MFKKKPQTEFDRYTDPTGEFSNRKLKMGQWYITHKELLRKILIGVLIVWDVVTISVGLFVWGKYLIYDYPRDEQMAADIGQKNLVSRAQIQAHLPQELNFGALQTWRGRGTTYDFGIEVTNLNEKWVAQVSFAIDYGSGQTDDQSEIILPGQTRMFGVFGIEPTGGVGSGRMVLKNIDWERIPTRDVPYPIDYIARRVQFDVSNVDFVAARAEENTPTNRISFDITNTSLFNYWDVPFVAIYRDGARITGIAPVSVDNFLAGETRSIEVASFVTGLRVERVELQPVLNVFDDSVYLD